MAEHPRKCRAGAHTVRPLITILSSRLFSYTRDNMKKHIRALSATVANNIADAGQEAVTRSANVVQHVLPYDQLPEWVRICWA